MRSEVNDIVHALYGSLSDPSALTDAIDILCRLLRAEAAHVVEYGDGRNPSSLLRIGLDESKADGYHAYYRHIDP